MTTTLDKTIPVRVPQETRDALNKEAAQRGVKLAWLVREILTAWAVNEGALPDTLVHIPMIPFTGKGDEIGAAERRAK